MNGKDRAKLVFTGVHLEYVTCREQFVVTTPGARVQGI